MTCSQSAIIMEVWAEATIQLTASNMKIYSGKTVHGTNTMTVRSALLKKIICVHQVLMFCSIRGKNNKNDMFWLTYVAFL
jgi:hypothetical protein